MSAIKHWKRIKYVNASNICKSHAVEEANKIAAATSLRYPDAKTPKNVTVQSTVVATYPYENMINTTPATICATAIAWSRTKQILSVRVSVIRVVVYLKISGGIAVLRR